MKYAIDYSGVSETDVRRYIPLIWSIIGKRRYEGNLSSEEKYSAGLHGLVNGLKKYDPKRGTNITLYLYYNIEFYIRNEARAAQKNINSQAEIFDYKKYNLDCLFHRRTNDFEEIEIFKSLINFLDQRSRRILENIFVYGKTQRECSLGENVSAARINQIYKSAMAKIKKRLVNR